MNKFIDKAVTVIKEYEEAFRWDYFDYIGRFDTAIVCGDGPNTTLDVKNGENMDKAKLYQFLGESISYYYTGDEVFIGKVEPIFYYYNKVIYLAGYVPLIPKSKYDEFVQEKTREKRLKEYLDKIFYGIDGLELSPVFCD